MRWFSYALIAACFGGTVLAQSVLTLEDFDMGADADDTGAASPVAAQSDMEACLLDQSSCANDEFRSATALSLDDVVNLGIVDHEEAPLSVSTETSPGVPAKIVSASQTLPTIDMEILFDSGSDQVRGDQVSKLVDLSTLLKSEKFDGYRFLFLGHTDAKGDQAYNMTLSNRRAQSVANLVRGFSGLDPSRVLSSGMGESRLKDPSFPLAGFNRRVQLVLVPR
nr:OmpA family protein [uncultured Shimia sp.]